MKKIRFILASALLVAAVSAQSQDTTRGSDPAAKDRSGPGLGAQGQNQGEKVQQSHAQDYKKDMTVIESSEVPASLRTTLDGAKYKGWEGKSTIYRSKDSDRYIVEMRQGNETKFHHFDQSGKEIKDY